LVCDVCEMKMVDARRRYAPGHDDIVNNDDDNDDDVSEWHTPRNQFLARILTRNWFLPWSLSLNQRS